MDATHTPTPWYTGSDCIIRDSDGEHIAELRSGSYETSSANANLIVRAVNAHDDLLTACELTIELSQHADGCKWWDVPARELLSEVGRAKADGRCDCHMKAARAAVAKATRTTP